MRILECFVMLPPQLRWKHEVFNIFRFFVPLANGGGTGNYMLLNFETSHIFHFIRVYPIQLP